MPVLKFFRKLTKRFFIIANIVVAALFIIACYGYYVDPTRFWFIGLLNLGSLILFAILILFIFFWLIAKPAYMLIGVVTIVLTWSPLKNLIRLQMAPAFTMNKHPSHLRVMDWNAESFNLIRKNENPGGRDEMYRIVQKYNPDVAIFQEASIGDSSKSAINYLPDMMKAFGMKYYHFSYGQIFDKDHQYGKIIMSKYPLVSKHTIDYGKRDYNSMYQFADIAFQDDTFRIFNIHLQSLRLSQNDRAYIGDKDYNVNETRSILGKIKYAFFRRKFQADRVKATMNESPYPVILGGDFNDVPNSYAYHTIGKNLKNAFVEQGTGIGRTFHYISPTLRIDNIFVNPKFSVEQFTVVKQNAVEHNPLVTDIYFTETK